LCRRGQTDFRLVRQGGGASCGECGFRWTAESGIIRALPAERQRHYARFVRDYLNIRRDEGRGSDDPAYYWALPYRDLSGRLASQWKMRGRTWRYVEGKIFPRLRTAAPQGLDVLDLGAGVGWLSYRVALHGHRPVAVDLLDDGRDGLGAARHYFSRLPRVFPLIQAEFDRLPFADAQFDLAIFNSSFHYSVSYRDTLQEVRRCLRWPGRVLILDSPLYKRSGDGELMREERHKQFERRFGFRSDSIPSIEYLDERMLRDLARDANLHWRIHRPWYGWRWRLRPLRAWLARRRAPSRFWILEGTWGIS
jgi:ubiquinone/menaquinone biosynthesis C-methylase UbiE